MALVSEEGVVSAAAQGGRLEGEAEEEAGAQCDLGLVTCPELLFSAIPSSVHSSFFLL